MPPRTAGKRKISYAESEEDDEGSDFAKGPSSEDDSGGDDDDASIDSVPKKSPKKQSPAKSDKKSKVENKKSPGKSSIAANKEAPKTVKSAEQHASISTFTAALGSAALGNVPPLSAVVDITQGPPVTTDTAAKKLIQQYMKQQNRPYSALQIHDNLHKRIPKATVERVLTNLSNPGEGLLCKEYGKMKIYFVDQSTLTTDFTEEQLDQLKGDNDDLKDQIEQLLLQEKEKRSNLAKLSTEPTDDDLDR